MRGFSVGVEVEVRVDDLLSALKKNRANHLSIYQEARQGYLRDARKAMGVRSRAMKAALDKLEAGEALSTSELPNMEFQVEPPSIHLETYDSIIGMLEMSTQDTITLNSGDYEKFVNDRWDWQMRWLLSNSLRSVAAADYAKSLSGVQAV